MYQEHQPNSYSNNTTMSAPVSRTIKKRLTSTLHLLFLFSLFVSTNSMAAAPVVSITSPAANSQFASPSNITITANATNAAGATITQVQFYRGTTLIGTDTTAPYSIVWSNATNGNYNITAKATNSANQVTTSAIVAIKVNNPPVVTLTAPVNNTSVAGKATVNLTATASDTGGSISKVEFYQGSTLLATDTTSPYSFSWTNVVPGTYSITAKATDNLGGTKVSTAATLTVTNPLATSITAPAANSQITVGTAITINANVSTSKTGTTISKVEFYQGSTLISTDTSAPYSATWSNAPLGNYSITSKVTDSQGLTQTSSPVTIEIKAASIPPTVSLTTPATNANFIAPASITLSSNAVANGTSNGTSNSISKVEYYQGATLVATSAINPSNPNTATWTNVTAGSYSITAKATDKNNNSTSSSPVAITVINNSAPTISVTANPTSAVAPATIIINATATDTDGTISKVDFITTPNAAPSTIIATVTTPTTPTSNNYNYQWQNLAAGNYNLTAKATDNLGASTTSSNIPISVTAYVPKIYDIHTDHLGTPRMVTDSTGAAVWEWNSTPFGESLPNQNPGNTGVQNDFVMNLRFPGQTYDLETGLHYNYFRDYDPSTGRYVESDPIGLSGGINTYGYVFGNPARFVDPLGLWVVTIEFYDFFGGGLTFGKDPRTGQGFITVRIGVGFGGGVQYDPNGGRPGSDSYCKKNGDGGGFTAGWQSSGGGGIGVAGAGFSGGVGGGGGFDFGSGKTYKDNLSPSVSGGYTPGGKTGAGLGGGISFEFGLYDKGDKKCGCQ